MEVYESILQETNWFIGHLSAALQCHRAFHPKFPSWSQPLSARELIKMLSKSQFCCCLYVAEGVLSHDNHVCWLVCLVVTWAFSYRFPVLQGIKHIETRVEVDVIVMLVEVIIAIDAHAFWSLLGGSNNQSLWHGGRLLGKLFIHI